jgi:integrase
MATLRKRKTKDGYVYMVDFYYKSKRYIKSTKTSEYRLAKQIMKDIEGKIARGNFKLEEYKERHINMSGFLVDYFNYAKSYKQPGTISLERIISKTFIDCVGDLDLRNIGTQQIDSWKSSRLHEVSPATFNIELRTLKATFNVAKRWGFVEVNPLDQVRKVKVEEKRLYMTNSELERFFETLETIASVARTKSRKERAALLSPYYEFLLNTGLRREEALNVTMDDIDRDHKVIFVRKSKDKEARVVPLTARAMAIINSLPNLFAILSKSYVTHNFTLVCHEAGLTGFKLHSLRHTYATRLIDSGVDVLIVSRILGHSDIKTTMIYAKVRLEVLKKAATMLEKGNLPVTKWYLEDGQKKTSDEGHDKIREFISNYCARDRT